MREKNGKIALGNSTLHALTLLAADRKTSTATYSYNHSPIKQCQIIFDKKISYRKQFARAFLARAAIVVDSVKFSCHLV